MICGQSRKTSVPRECSEDMMGGRMTAKIKAWTRRRRGLVACIIEKAQV
jgi:hypothetical protein